VRDKTDPDKSFERASKTWVRKTRSKTDFNPDFDTVIVKKFTTEEDFVAAWKEINALVEELLDLVETDAGFSHSDEGGLQFLDGELDKKEIAKLPKLDWTSTGKPCLQGCNTATGKNSLASQVAASQGIKVAGQPGASYFSESPIKYVPIDQMGPRTSTEV
jgi:hypothetical protein